jgi:large subunit ribosomal protein L25
MSDLIVEAEPRTELGKNANRRLRASGRIPGVVYGQSTESVSVSVNPKKISSIIHSDTGHNTIFKLELNSEKLNVLIRDLQVDPVRGHLLHADFQTIAMDEARVFAVPLEPQGESEGVKEGGILDIVVREIEVECLPTDVPDQIQVDVSALEIGDALRVSDLTFESDKVSILSSPELVLLTVTPPKVEIEEEVEGEETPAEEGTDQQEVGQEASKPE